LRKYQHCYLPFTRVLKDENAVTFDGLGTVTFIGVEYTVEGNSTFTYEVTSGRKPSISHWNLNFVPCDPEDGVSEIVVLESTDESTEFGKDGSLKKYNDELKILDWLKFDTGYEDNETRTISATLEGHWYVDEVLAVAKGGKNFAQAFIEGPVCEPCWECGEQLLDERNGQTYETVQIGNQCWIAENLNIGTMINGGLNQTNNTTIEKYCYNNDELNCDTYGGLYQWNEMMHYVTTESTQGICPIGWHLPSEDEFKTLEMQLGMTQAQADANGWRGTHEAIASKLAGNSALWWDGPLDNSSKFGTSGFAALPEGSRHSEGTFNWQHDYAFFWMSTEYIDSYPRFRALHHNYRGVFKS